MEDFKFTLWGRDRPKITNPTNEQISDYILSMYPHDWDTVAFHTSSDTDDRHGHIMGRSVENDRDKVVVFCEPIRRHAEFRYLRLIDPTIPEGGETINIILNNGQEDEYPQREGVTKEAVIVAFVDFLRTGEASKRLTWLNGENIIQPTEDGI